MPHAMVMQKTVSIARKIFLFFISARFCFDVAVRWCSDVSEHNAAKNNLNFIQTSKFHPNDQFHATNLSNADNNTIVINRDSPWQRMKKVIQYKLALQDFMSVP